jgi:excisionase family DNA binding protein
MTPARTALRIADEQDTPSPELREPPEVLTVEEAAAVLRISRNSAYSLARQWLATCGAEGLPVVKLGRTLRVPRSALLRILQEPEIERGSPSS